MPNTMPIDNIVKYQNVIPLETRGKRAQFQLVVSSTAPKITELPVKARKRKIGKKEPPKTRPGLGSTLNDRFHWLMVKLCERDNSQAMGAVAEKYGMDPAQVSRMINGGRGITITTIQSFVQQSRINPRYLLLGETKDDFI